MLANKIKPNELDERYFNLMDKQDNNGGVFALMEKYENAVVRSYGKSLKELHSRLDFLADTFYTPNQFKEHSTLTENLLTLNSAFIDIDVENQTNLTPEHKLNIWHMILKESRLPRPSVVVDSGNGIHIYYLLKKGINDNTKTGIFKSMFERINIVFAEKIEQAIQKTFSIDDDKLSIPLFADMKATNSSRLLRLPATRNGKKVSHVIELNPNNRYTIDELMEYLPKYDKTKTRAYNRAKYGEYSHDTNIRYISNIKRLNENRVRDLFRWAELRNYNLNSQRNEFFHILTSQCMHRELDMSEWLPDIYELNNQLTDPLSEHELSTIIESSERKEYLYRNSTITTKLGITDEEINQMITIRRTSRREQREKAREAKQERNELVHQLHNQGWNVTDISKEVGISRPTVYSILEE